MRVPTPNTFFYPPFSFGYMAPEFDRRDILRLGGVGLGTGLTGCSRYLSNDGEAKTSQVSPEGVSVLWRHDTGSSAPGDFIHDEIVYAASNPSDGLFDETGGVYAFDLKTGEEIWHYSNIAAERSNPVVTQGIVLANDSKALVALNADTGEEQWRRTWEGFITSGPAVGNNTVYIGNTSPTTSHSASKYPEDLFALSLHSGELVWRRQLGAVNNDHTRVAGWRPPVFYERLNLLFLPITTGSAVVLNARDGSIIGSLSPEPSSGIDDGMFLEADTVFGVFGNQLYAYKPDSRKIVWHASEVSLPGDGGGGRVVGGNDKKFQVFSAQSGDRIWSKGIGMDTGDWSTFSATETGIYATIRKEGKTSLLKFDTNGSKLWELGIQTDAISQVYEYNETVVIGTGAKSTPDDAADGTIYALKGNG